MNDTLLPTIDLDRCTGCGLCMEYCPTNAVDMVAVRPTGHRPEIARPQDCVYCGACEDMCPVEAIALVYEVVLSSTSE